MGIHEVKLEKPKWFYDPPTNRQLKVINFFGHPITSGLNKGRAGGIIGSIFRDDNNKELWLKYIYHTGDESQDSPDLLDFDFEELLAVVVPSDWKPKTARTVSVKSASGLSERQLTLRQMVIEMLREFSPFDDPVPDIRFGGTGFAFTGKFVSGTRKECHDAVEELGAHYQSNVTRSTDYLVIGNEGSEHWAEGTHGRKIEQAIIFRLETSKPAILSEADWLKALQLEKLKR